MFDGVYSTVFVFSSIFTGMGSVNILTTGQLASVLRQAASISSFLAFAATLTLIVTLSRSGELSGFSASVTTSMLSTSMLLCFATLAKMVTAQSERAMIASSSAVGPESFPPWATGKSHTMLWVRELSTVERTFSSSLALDVIFPIVFYLSFLFWS